MAKTTKAASDDKEPMYLTKETGISVSISRKLNLGNYESADIFMSVNGLEPGASDAEIEEALATGDRAFQILRKHVAAKIVELRKGALA